MNEQVSPPSGDLSSAGSPLSFISVVAHQILDSRGYPTVHVALGLEDGTHVEASAPAGASTGTHEAAELRDGGSSYSGRSVHGAIIAVTDEIRPLLTSHTWASIYEVDTALRNLDGTHNLRRLGANAVVAVSIAASRAFAHQSGVPLNRWIAQATGATELLPVPHFNVLNGGAHAANDLDFQEFMIAPVSAPTEERAVQAGAEIYHALAAEIRRKYNTSGLGDEGGFAPPITHPEEALDLLVQSIARAGYTPGTNHIAVAVDPAANAFYEGDGVYRVAGKKFSRAELAGYYAQLLDNYPIRIIEDGFAEDDTEGWALFFRQAGNRVQLVGDDLYVTDPERIKAGSENDYSNAALIKPNQIGTVSQTLQAISTARECGMASMVSHRSGETEDTFIADLVVGTGVGQIKSGAPARGERVVKYNRLMEIEAHTPRLKYGLR